MLRQIIVLLFLAGIAGSTDELREELEKALGPELTNLLKNVYQQEYDVLRMVILEKHPTSFDEFMRDAEFVGLQHFRTGQTQRILYSFKKLYEAVGRQVESIKDEAAKKYAEEAIPVFYHILIDYFKGAYHILGDLPEHAQDYLKRYSGLSAESQIEIIRKFPIISAIENQPRHIDHIILSFSNITNMFRD